MGTDWADGVNAGQDPLRAADEAWTKSKSNGKADVTCLMSSGEFVGGFVAPDYLIDRVLQRRFVYSLTAPTGAGKTAVSLTLGAHVALGRNLGGHEVEKGRVLCLMGENPDDVRGRWLAMAYHLKFDAGEIPVHFKPGVFSIPELKPNIENDAKALGGFALVIVDTSAAYFVGEQENDNVQLGNHARMLRELTTLPGGPTVIVNCHPTKNASNDNLLPRGGGAFLAEVDGNLVCLKNDTTVEMSWQGKFRGPDFDALPFELRTVTCETVKDSRGRQMPTVIARHLSDQEHREKASASIRDQDALLLVMVDGEADSLAKLADRCGWVTSAGHPAKQKVHRLLDQLRKDKLARNSRGKWTLTDAGKKEAKTIAANAALAGAKYA